MQNTFETELSNIDKAYVEERKTTLFANKKGTLACTFTDFLAPHSSKQNSHLPIKLSMWTLLSDRRAL